MSNSEHDWLDDIPLADGIWLEMLVDGELSPSQRARFVDRVRETNDWQCVATAFLDEQVMSKTVPFEQPKPLVVRPRPVAQSGAGWSRTLAVAAACLVCGLFFGSLFSSSSGSEVVAGTNTKAGGQAVPPEESADVSAKPCFVAEASLPALFQVCDTPEEAVYYADFSVPQFLLDSLLLAGHNVKLEQDFLGYTESPDSLAAVPINVIRIEKYGRLLASAEPVGSVE